MITSKSDAVPFAIGERVTGMVLRFDAATASFVLQLHGNVPAVISTYEVPDAELELLTPGSSFEAFLDRVDNVNGHTIVVLSKDAQPIAV